MLINTILYCPHKTDDDGFAEFVPLQNTPKKYGKAGMIIEMPAF